jgi:hypothetical protein
LKRRGILRSLENYVVDTIVLVAYKKALFLKPEKEMLKDIELLRKLPIPLYYPWRKDNFNVKFMLTTYLKQCFLNQNTASLLPK